VSLIVIICVETEDVTTETLRKSNAQHLVKSVGAVLNCTFSRISMKRGHAAKGAANVL
jgi:hypothetical protein